jgi:hypothetical protein
VGFRQLSLIYTPSPAPGPSVLVLLSAMPSRPEFVNGDGGERILGRAGIPRAYARVFRRASQKKTEN